MSFSICGAGSRLEKNHLLSGATLATIGKGEKSPLIHDRCAFVDTNDSRTCQAVKLCKNHGSLSVSECKTDHGFKGTNCATGYFSLVNLPVLAHLTASKVCRTTNIDQIPRVFQQLKRRDCYISKPTCSSAMARIAKPFSPQVPNARGVSCSIIGLLQTLAIPEMFDGKIYRKALYLVVKNMGFQ